ncbi:MAG: LysR substrate-binding domain-containing protein [Dokdonella sp.]|nr:LysR family transcriptional regulator [Dokdonella sp.]MCB1569792.1 LysR family transcriptional regulator [Xanthomonadales bacterium]MCB1573043.1 LysR family transcriptional regulator [Xanthomonadales bacterium]MCB1576014.1 LysR family transcriptional regulator [Xanthomonadales bacterium]
MNLRDLRYLVALSEYKHFGRAAEASFVSQPTLSTQIKKLEDELGVALVERTPRKVLLTEVGREIALRARDVLNEVEQIRAIARRTLDPESGTVRLGIFPTLGPYLLPHMVPRIRARFPRLELLLLEEKTENVLRQLREGRIDAGILALPVHDHQLHVEKLFEEPFVLAVPEDNPLVGRNSLKLEDLADQSILLLEDGHCLRDQALEVCQMAGAGEKAGFRATSLETLRQMVAANVGITLLPTLAVKPPVPQVDHVRLIRFSGRAPSRHIAMVWRKSSALNGFLGEFARLFRELPAQLLDPDDLFDKSSPRAPTGKPAAGKSRGKASNKLPSSGH